VRESETVLGVVAAVRDQGAAVVLVTHNAYQAHASGDRFLILQHGQVAGSFERAAVSLTDLLALMAGGSIGDLDPDSLKTGRSQVPGPLTA
jgi:simple sugar transport system ATP-binding protein